MLHKIKLVLQPPEEKLAKSTDKKMKSEKLVYQRNFKNANLA